MPGYPTDIPHPVLGCPRTATDRFGGKLRILQEFADSAGSRRMSAEGLVLGPVGFEPTTKGFTEPRRFRREWTISSPVHWRMRVGAGCSTPVIKGAQALR